MASGPNSRTKTHRFPSFGRVLKSVELEDGESVRVKSGDTLIGYSIAIHNGDPRFANEFGRFTKDPSKKTGGKIVQLSPFTQLRPGEVLVHIPSSSQGKNDVPTLKPISKADYNRLIQMFCVEVKMPIQFRHVVSWAAKGVSAARLSALLTELAFKSVQIGAMGSSGTALGTVAGTSAAAAGGSGVVAAAWVWLQVAAPFMQMLTSFLAINRAMTTTYRITYQLGYAYGLSAWVFGKKQPPSISPELKKRYTKTCPQRLHEHEARWNRGARLAFQTGGPKLARDAKLSDDVFRLLMQGTFKNKPQDYCHFVMGLIGKQLPIEQRFAYEEARGHGILYPN